MDRWVSYFTDPPASASVLDWTIAMAAVMGTAAIVMILIALAQFKLRRTRIEFGAEIATHLAYAWACLFAGIILFLDAAILLYLSRVPDWTAVTPHAVAILIACLAAFLIQSSVRRELKASQVPLRRARQGR